MKNKALKDGLEAYVRGFGNHMGNAIESIHSAAVLYAEAIRKYKDKAQDRFEEAYPHVTANTWDKLRLVGNDEADPKIMLLSDRFAARIIRMPLAKQQETLNGDSFEIVHAQTRKIRRIHYFDVTPQQERILFDDEKNRVRTLPEQVEYIDKENAKRKKMPRPYSVETDALVVHQACRIGKNELEDIIEEMQ